MSVGNLILLIIFLWCRAIDSKQSGGFKLQMKDGNFFFDDGSGDVPIEVIDKGPDLSCLQDSSVRPKSTSSNLIKTLKILDRTISDLGNYSNKKQFSALKTPNQREKISELRRLLGETNLVEIFHGDDNDLKASSKDNPQDIHDYVPNINGTVKEIKESKVSDADLEKIREVLDKEYGKSILLIPKNELEAFINFIKDYSLNDLLRSGDYADLKNADDRVRMRNPSNAPRFQLNFNRMLTSQPRGKVDNHETSEENRQKIMQEFALFLDQINSVRDSVLKEPTKLNSSVSDHSDTNSKIPYLARSDQNNEKYLSRQDPLSLEIVKNFLENLSEDKSQLKQSLIRWFDSNSESDTQHHKHYNIRRSVKNSSATPSPSKNDKKDRKGPQKDLKSSFDRISRGDYTHLRKHKQSREFTDNPEYERRFRDNQDLAESKFVSRSSYNPNEKSVFADEETLNEAAVSGERHTRADIIR